MGWVLMLIRITFVVHQTTTWFKHSCYDFLEQKLIEEKQKKKIGAGNPVQEH